MIGDEKEEICRTRLDMLSGTNPPSQHDQPRAVADLLWPERRREHYPFAACLHFHWLCHSFAVFLHWLLQFEVTACAPLRRSAFAFDLKCYNFSGINSQNKPQKSIPNKLPKSLHLSHYRVWGSNIDPPTNFSLFLGMFVLRYRFSLNSYTVQHSMAKHRQIMFTELVINAYGMIYIIHVLVSDCLWRQFWVKLFLCFSAVSCPSLPLEVGKDGRAVRVSLQRAGPR